MRGEEKEENAREGEVSATLFHSSEKGKRKNRREMK